MDFLDKQIAPPRSWDTFENLTRDLFAEIWKDPLAQRHGRSGQRQFGVDVIGTPGQLSGRTFGVQCKGKTGAYGAAATTDEFDAELAKAELFDPPLSHWTFVTTAPDDGELQRHAKVISRRRVAAGLFPVVALGWETFQALLAGYPTVIATHYPEHSSVLNKVMAALERLAASSTLGEVRESLSGPGKPALSVRSGIDWFEERFDTQRDLGPALMGRPLGPADIAACPPLPEVATLLGDLARAGNARLAGVAGAGKSICSLQVAHALHRTGWRILRLPDPTGGLPAFRADDDRTLYLIDDAHLAYPGHLRVLEEATTGTRRLLTAHTTLDGKSSIPGTIHLDAKRAVIVIADGLRASPQQTLAAVKAADSRIGSGIGDESLEDRLREAEKAEFPWQFCFILGGGWNRAKAMADSARAAGAELVLAAAAIRQMASRDASCSLAALEELLKGQVPTPKIRPAVDWLIGQRLLLGETDLRCPHQRLAGVLLSRILEGCATEARTLLGRLLHAVLADPELPLGGLALLIRELDFNTQFGAWRSLITPAALEPALKRAWAAEGASDIREACWFLREATSYLGEDRKDIEAHKDVLSTWIAAAPEGACYSISAFFNRVINIHDDLVAQILASVPPAKMAHAVTSASALHASEIVDLLSTLRVGSNAEWSAAFLTALDRDACFRLVKNWPTDAWMSAAAGYCAHLFHLDEEFGLALIEALIPAIANRITDDPAHAFHELDSIVWHSLRLYDPFDVYKGDRAPTARMKKIGRQIVRCWSPTALAAKLSQGDQRTFQSAAGVLLLCEKVAPKVFEKTVLSLDWAKIDATIGADWAEYIGDARQLFSVAWSVPDVRPTISALIAGNETRILSLSPQLALMSPATAVRIVEAGKTVSICRHSHVEWLRGVLVAARMAQMRPDLVHALLTPHYAGLAANLSQPSPSFWHEASYLLAFIADQHPQGLTQILDALDVEKVSVGWTNALKRQEVSGAVSRSEFKAEHVAALLIHHALQRKDPLGALAVALRHRYPKRSIPPADLLEPFDPSLPLD